MVGAGQQRTTPADGAETIEEWWRAATRAAQEVRDTGKVAGGEREEMGARETRENRKQHLARRLPLSHCNHCNNRSICSDSALTMTHATSRRNVDFMDGVNESDDLTQEQPVVQHSNVLSGLKHLRDQEYVV